VRLKQQQTNPRSASQRRGAVPDTLQTRSARPRAGGHLVRYGVPQRRRNQGPYTEPAAAGQDARGVDPAEEERDETTGRGEGELKAQGSGNVWVARGSTVAVVPKAHQAKPISTSEHLCETETANGYNR
jgi:hypothetical protein